MENYHSVETAPVSVLPAIGKYQSSVCGGMIGIIEMELLEEVAMNNAYSWRPT